MQTDIRPGSPATTMTASSAAPVASRRGRRSNLSAPVLLEHALARGEGVLTDDGALAVRTGEHTGRSPRDKYLVAGEPWDDQLWWGANNQPIAAAAFAQLQSDVLEHLAERDHFRMDLSACADPAFSTPVQVLTERAWCALFASHLLLPPTARPGQPRLTILHAPGFLADPRRHETRSSTAIAMSLEQRLVVICGTEYAGEIKKSVFTALQAFLPWQGVATMHCSANGGDDSDTALFFGLSGTGKTTLSTDGRRRLIGDDEHGWGDGGIFNFEGGSYAKVIDLSAHAEPQIHQASCRFGTILENVVLDPETRRPDWRDRSLTENTRAAFPLEAVPGVDLSGRGGHPRNVLFLSADAFGVLPPVARLTADQAMYWYLTGYTSKLAGTEKGVSDPAATFSACFGSPFMPLPPVRYAELLGAKIREHGPDVWLVNTGWSGGPAGVGSRMPIALTRAVVDAILDGSLADVPSIEDPLFGFRVPERLPNVPDAPLVPRETWADPNACDRHARRLAQDIHDNFRTFRDDVTPEVAAAGPRV